MRRVQAAGTLQNARCRRRGAVSKPEIEKPLSLYTCNVAPDWIDYNDHMTEASYLTAFGWASDALFRFIGIDDDYRAAGHSFYTVETHINFYREAKLGEPLKFTTQILDIDEKRLHLFHAMFHGEAGHLLATTEQMLLHVDMQAGRATATLPHVYAKLEAILQVHRGLPRPPQVGRKMAIGKQKGA